MYNQIDESAQEYLKQRRKGRLTFIAIALLFFGPFILAALAFRIGWVPQSATVNRGDLVQATIPLLDSELAVLERDENVLLRHKWSLLMFVPDPCKEECKAHVDKFEVVHFRLNRDIERVQMIAANNSRVVKSPFARKLSQEASHSDLLKSMDAAGISADGVYIVDPRGFPVLHYPLDSDPENLQKDLKRLLKYSK